MFSFAVVILFLSFNFSEQFCPFGVRKHVNFAFHQQPISNNPIGTTRLCLSNSSNNENNTSNTKPPRKKKKKIVINQNLVGVSNVSSDGLLIEQKKEQKEAQKARESTKSNLGVPSRSKKKKDITTKKLSKKAQKLADQRTANGTIDGNLQAGLALPEDQKIQIQELKRGNKQVTIVRGFLCSMDDRKSILKEVKKKIGGGGSLIEGVIELQGNHAEVVLKFLKSKGYVQAEKQ